MYEFSLFAKEVHARYSSMTKSTLYEVKMDRNEMFEAYLAAFPPGNDPIYITRTEHSCNCCSNFIRNLGNLVTIKDGVVSTIWDVKGLEYLYDVVAKQLHELVLSKTVQGVFFSSEQSYGNAQTKQLLASGAVKTWNHFYGQVSNTAYTKEVGKKSGEITAIVQVMKRGLTEIRMEVLQDMLDMINDTVNKPLYRGSEFKAAVQNFINLKKTFDKAADKDLFVWENYTNANARFRNTVIGTLAVDLSDGIDLDVAVKAYGVKVDPVNYKHPTSLVTPAMAKQAVDTIKSLGLEPSMERRMAVLGDISVQNVLWIDNSVQNQLKDGLLGLVMEGVKEKPVDMNKATEIKIADFMSQILPKASSIELCVENRHQGNFVTLTAPVNPVGPIPLFQWKNEFGWAYEGGVTDSIIETRVKAKGGKTNATLRCSLAWFNKDDQDLYVKTPKGETIYFGNRGRKHTGNGQLDVDANGPGSPSTNEPVENITWDAPPDGDYSVYVNMYSKRSTSKPGFSFELVNAGITHTLNKETNFSGNCAIATFTVKNNVVTKFTPANGLTASTASQDKWGISTNQFTKVNTIMYSPNHWDSEDAKGNLHHFFFIDKCKNDEPVRGFFNEFLNPALTQHRKTFEILGSKIKCAPTQEQLSGLGFSSTRSDKVIIRATGKDIQGIYNVTF